MQTRRRPSPQRAMPISTVDGHPDKASAQSMSRARSDYDIRGSVLESGKPLRKTHDRTQPHWWTNLWTYYTAISAEYLQHLRHATRPKCREAQQHRGGRAPKHVVQRVLRRWTAHYKSLQKTWLQTTGKSRYYWKHPIRRLLLYNLPPQGQRRTRPLLHRSCRDISVRGPTSTERCPKGREPESAIHQEYDLYNHCRNAQWP